MRALVALSVAVSVAVAPIVPVGACCMVPATYTGTISQGAHEAIVFHDAGREELILRIKYAIAGETMPDSFAWVITVPTNPDGYRLAPADLFEQVFKWAEPRVRIPPRLGEKKSKEAGGVWLHEKVVVGPYSIQPVEALGAEALTGLNGWLEKNGFPTEDPGHMKYFVENRFTFLCVKIEPREGEKTVAAGGPLPPLHLSFASPKPYYPLRFSSRQGIFDLNLYVFTGERFDYESSHQSLDWLNWRPEQVRENVEVETSSFPKSLAAVYDKTRFDGKRTRWHLNLLRTYRINDRKPIASWKRDIFFETRS